jgi:hypothetical protein
MTHTHRLAAVAGLVVGLSIAAVPMAAAQDPSPAPTASPEASVVPGASLTPVASPCPSPAALASPVVEASISPVASASPDPAAAGTSFVQAEPPCPGDIAAIAIPPGATIEEILALGIGGVELTVQSSPLQFVDPSSRWYRQLTRALRSQDKKPEDVLQHLGVSEPDEVLVGAFQVDGADASALVDNAIDWFLQGFPSSRYEREAGVVGGKEVAVIRPARLRGRIVYAYPSGDAVWFVMAPDAYATEFLAALP